MKTTKLSAVRAKWIGVRLERIGRAADLLKSAGFMRLQPAQLNNRNAFNWVRPCALKTIREHAEFLKQLGRAGAQGIAIEFTDLQWKHNAGLTDAQWQARVIIDKEAA